MSLFIFYLIFNSYSKIKVIISVFVILCFSFATYGQKTNKKIIITGTVVNKDNTPVAGAVIFVDKVKTNAVTNQMGKYKIKVSPDAKKILAFTFLNGSSEKIIDGKESVDFVLAGLEQSADSIGKEEINNLSEAKNKSADKRSSKALGIVNGQDQEFASSQSIYDMIRGRFPGVNVVRQEYQDQWVFFTKCQY